MTPSGVRCEWLGSGRMIACMPYVIVGLSAMFYVYEFFLRVVLSTISSELMQALQTDAAGLGIISAAFYYAYTGMQIPAGLLCDRFGPRRLLVMAVALCAFAAYLFSFTTTTWVAFCSRFLIGFASSFAFVGPLALASKWFDSKRFALIAGLIQLMGCVGAIVGETPVAILTVQFGWRQVIFWSSLFGILLAMSFWLVLRDAPSTTKHIKSNKPNAQPEKISAVGEWRRLKSVCGNNQTWWVAVAAFACWGPIVVFAELWGVSFFMKLQQIDAAQAASQVVWIWVGIALASPLAGWWSNRIMSRRIPLMVCFSLSLLATVWIVYLPVSSVGMMNFLMFILGCSAAAQPVTFGLVGDNNQTDVVATAVGLNNMAVISGGVLLQPIVGFVLHYLWGGELISGVPYYDIESFRVAFLMMPLCGLVGFLVTWLRIKETHCRQQP